MAERPERRKTSGLDALPDDVAGKLAFEEAAPAALRRAPLPDEVREELAHVWDDLIAQVYDEVRSLGFAEARKPRNLRRLLRNLSGQLDEAQRVLIVLGTLRPIPARSGWRHTALAAGVSGAATGVEQAMVVASIPTAAATAITTAVVAELLEVYLVASARTRQYLSAQRAPSPEVIAADLADALAGGVVSRSAARRSTHQALSALAARLLSRCSQRLVKGVAIVAGVAWATASSARTLQKVQRLDLAVPGDDELERLRLRNAGEGWRDSAEAMALLSLPPAADGDTDGPSPDGPSSDRKTGDGRGAD